MAQQSTTAMSTGVGSAGDAPTFMPPADIFETKDAIIMFLDVPGADPNSLDVTLEQRELSISAHSTASPPQGYAPVYAEYREGNYERAFTLSDEVDRDRVDGVFKDGVLRLTLPKTKSSPAKKISVKST
jgi:HSP20 family protein